MICSSVNRDRDSIRSQSALDGQDFSADGSFSDSTLRSVNVSSSMATDSAPVPKSRSDQTIGEPSPPLWEEAAVIFVIVMMTGALIGPVFAPTQVETPVLRLVWLPVYAIIVALLIMRADKVVRVWPAVLILGSLVLYAWASQYWSIDAETTSRRVISLAMTGAFSIYLGAAFEGPHLPRMLMRAGVLMGLGSFVMVLAFPSIGLHVDVNAPLWRGLWYEKNQMGFVMVAVAIGAAACLATDDRRRLLPATALVMSSVLVLATQSKTSLLCLGVGLCLIIGLFLLRRGGPAFAVVAIWFVVIVGAASVWFIMTDPAAVLDLLGKDPTLTGRTLIWDSLMRRVEERPWAGYGYAAFWGRESVPAAFVRQETEWQVPSAHHGWLDLLLQLGWIGVMGVGVMVAGTVLITLSRLGGAGVREGYWGLGYLGAFLVLSLSESVVLTHANLPWALVMAILTRAVAPGCHPARVIVSRRRGVRRVLSTVPVSYAHRTYVTPGSLPPPRGHARRKWS